jgi:hypothetical protein
VLVGLDDAISTSSTAALLCDCLSVHTHGLIGSGYAVSGHTQACRSLLAGSCQFVSFKPEFMILLLSGHQELAAKQNRRTHQGGGCLPRRIFAQ